MRDAILGKVETSSDCTSGGHKSRVAEAMLESARSGGTISVKHGNSHSPSTAMSSPRTTAKTSSRRLGLCYASTSNQGPVEIVIVENGSTDGMANTASTCDGGRSADPSLKVLRSEGFG